MTAQILTLIMSAFLLMASFPEQWIFCDGFALASICFGAVGLRGCCAPKQWKGSARSFVHAALCGAAIVIIIADHL